MKYMDQTRTTGVREQPTAAAGDETAKRTDSGDVPAAVAASTATSASTPPRSRWSRSAATSTAGPASTSGCAPTSTPTPWTPSGAPRGGSAPCARPRSPRTRSKKPPRGLAGIPRRPAVRRSAQDSGNSGHHHRDSRTDPPTQTPRQVGHRANAAQFDALLPPPFGDRGVMHSAAAGGMLGGMAVAVLPWVLRGQAQPPSMYYPSPYHLSPRQRRRHVELERSLHQIWFFLFVFILLCLLLF